MYIDRTYHINAEGCCIYKDVGFSKHNPVTVVVSIPIAKPIGVGFSKTRRIFRKNCRIFQKALGFSRSA